MSPPNVFQRLNNSISPETFHRVIVSGPRRSGCALGRVAPSAVRKSGNDIAQHIPNEEATLRLSLGKSLLCSPRFRARWIGPSYFFAFAHLVWRAGIVVISRHVRTR
jgi:hypothetical protein